MKTWSQDNYIRAWNYASKAHQGQLVPGGDVPYINHIGLVAMEVMAAISRDDSVEKPDLAVLCALLHDTIEDTSSNYDDIKNEFGMAVANGVAALTKNTQLPSKEHQILDSLSRIKAQPKTVWIVKLADRITNLQPPPKHWDREKIKKYRIEALLILEHLAEANKYLADRLQQKIDNYP